MAIFNSYVSLPEGMLFYHGAPHGHSPTNHDAQRFLSFGSDLGAREKKRPTNHGWCWLILLAGDRCHNKIKLMTTLFDPHTMSTETVIRVPGSDDVLMANPCQRCWPYIHKIRGKHLATNSSTTSSWVTKTSSKHKTRAPKASEQPHTIPQKNRRCRKLLVTFVSTSTHINYHSSP